MIISRNVLLEVIACDETFTIVFKNGAKAVCVRNNSGWTVCNSDYCINIPRDFGIYDIIIANINLIDRFEQDDSEEV